MVDGKETPASGEEGRFGGFGRVEDLAVDVHEPVCIVLADMRDSTVFWAWAFCRDEQGARGDGERLRAAWTTWATLQTALIREMLGANGGRTAGFVKGVGDELIFTFEDAVQAYEAAEAAASSVAKVREELLQNLREFGKGLPDAALGFRFLIHFAADSVEAARPQRLSGLVHGWYSQAGDTFELVGLAKGADSLPTVVLPQAPDVFGHHMNYAARCIGVVDREAIFMTKSALDQYERRRGRKKRGCGWPIYVGGAKGVAEPLEVYRFGGQIDAREHFSSISAYQTKALVSLDFAEKKLAEDTWRRLETVLDTPEERKAPLPLYPHVMLGILTYRSFDQFRLVPDHAGVQVVDRTDSSAENEPDHRVMVRLEALTQADLNEIQSRKDGQARNVFGLIQRDMVTRFIRPSPKKADRQMDAWCSRAVSARSNRGLLFLEMQVAAADEIDNYFACLCNNYPTNVMEAGRMWGDRGLYAIVEGGAPSLDEDQVADQIRKIFEGPSTCDVGRLQGATVWVWAIARMRTAGEDFVR